MSEQSERLSVSLREYLEREVASLKEIIAAREQGAKMALDLQAKEYERRLEQLNHAHERSLEDRADFVQSDTYGTHVEQDAVWKRTTESAIAIVQRDFVRSSTFDTYLDGDRIWKRSVDVALAAAAGRREVWAAVGFAGVSIVLAMLALARAFAQ